MLICAALASLAGVAGVVVGRRRPARPRPQHGVAVRGALDARSRAALGEERHPRRQRLRRGGTDIEFQSRTAADGTVHDYAFVGTMGGGTRIFDVTDPARPFSAGQYTDPGYQNDVAVAGDLLVLGFDSLGASGATSACLKQKSSAVNGTTRGGIDIVRLVFDPQTATFETRLIDCYLSTLGTARRHTVTIHPTADWISVNTSFNGLEVVDVRSGLPRFVRHVPVSVVATRTTSRSRGTATRSTAPASSTTRVVDVTERARRASADRARERAQRAGCRAGRRRPDRRPLPPVRHDLRRPVLMVTDEAGGGLTETGCNQGADGKIGGAHVWTLGDLAAPRKLGTWLYPNPVLAPDPLAPALAAIGRTERACTIHVFRYGGNGSSGPGPVAAGFDGVSSLGPREVVTAHYGAGTWQLDVSAAASSSDGVAEDSRSTWGNTLGWNVMPGAETWSAKEYKGYVYTGDLARGFDVYRFGAGCDGIGCIASPVSTPGRAKGGGKVARRARGALDPVRDERGRQGELLARRRVRGGRRCAQRLDLLQRQGRHEGAVGDRRLADGHRHQGDDRRTRHGQRPAGCAARRRGRGPRRAGPRGQLPDGHR